MAEVKTDDAPVRGAENPIGGVGDPTGGAGDTGFDMPADDPRRTENRGGLEATVATAPATLPYVGGNRDTEGPTGAGPVEGSRSGVVAPRVEMSDVGLVDLNTAGMSPPGEGDDNASVPSDTQS